MKKRCFMGIDKKNKQNSQEQNKKNKLLGTENVVWNLDSLYESVDDELIRDDLDLCNQEAALLVEFCQGKLADLEAKDFARTVRRLERIGENLGRLEAYAFLNFSTRVDNSEAGAFLQQTTEEASKVRQQLVFFELEWGQLEESRAKEFLEYEEVAKYRHYLLKIRKQAVHFLSFDKEQLLETISPVARTSWNILFEKVMGNMRFGERHRCEEEVLADLYSPERDIRKNAAQDMTDGLQGQLHVLTHIFNTMAAEKMIVDGERAYGSWLSSMNLDNELADRTVDKLITAVTNRYGIVHRYYHLKKEFLGLDKLVDYDRYAPIPGMVKTCIPWSDCKRIVLDSFAQFSPELAEIGEKFFSEQWIHAPPAEGKQAGAFAHPCVADSNPRILVNYTGNLRDVSTVAHELGHGIHQYLAAGHGMYNSDTPLVLAETASVFAEFLIFKAQLGLLTDPKAKRSFICGKLESIFATVFRQVAMNRFEDGMHNGRRNGGELSPEQLSALWLDSQRDMFGDSVELSKGYGIWWSYIPHFLGSPGYVYSYAFGELLVLALYGRYLEEGDSFVDKYINLLASGGSNEPAELLAPFDIDLDDQQFWSSGIDIIEKMLVELEDGVYDA